MYFRYRWKDETVASQKPAWEPEMMKGLMLGVMDDSMDGKLQVTELKGQMGENIKKYFAMIDANKDGGIDAKELEAVQKMLGGGRGRRQPAAAAASGAPPTPAGGF